MIDRAQLISGTEKGKKRLGEITAMLQVAVDSPLADLIGAEDVHSDLGGAVAVAQASRDR
ncbi:hypothetical protein [Paractinoplanes rishiriensis]|uniref:Uncharacterized protein n=1 Tax=Paractinoplanes rishiriensis TaxID=1050105 RepID=A0A919K6M0_9ACTN|nr:hypothetical protein [Actinoplanes rishiriensis]GIE99498.1 hypothetical protein Ari01nite_69630 [Actinoplanes rishiriensis]